MRMWWQGMVMVFGGDMARVVPTLTLECVYRIFSTGMPEETRVTGGEGTEVVYFSLTTTSSRSSV